MNDVFKALSDPTRRQILQLLKEKDLTAGEIASYFDIAKPSISHHLNALKQAQLVLSEKQGQNVLYSLNTTTFQEAIRFFFEMLGKDDDHEKKS
ncbi:MAG: autorepressor SdpR family transcription factor [Cellulosilyticaceae bacterium]